jgi:Tol biopolymer transport system component
MFKRTYEHMPALHAARLLKTSLGKGSATARLLVFVSIAGVLTFTSVVSAMHFGAWSAPVNAESIAGTSSELNTPFNDGCPIQSPDGLSLFIASNRPGGLGGQDIWVARRATTDDPWGAPENLGAPVNSNVDDFCPLPVRGHGLFYVSARSGGCGGPDIYFTRLQHGEWQPPENVGCDINSSAGEASPSYFEDDNGNALLYFSSTRAGGFEPGGVDSDIYFSMNFGPAQLAPGLNTASDDSRPNVRKDGREIVFDSTRAGTLGGPDIWTAKRESVYDDWPSPTHLDAPINSAANETRATLSWDALTMVFGSTRTGSEGSTDVYVTTRDKLKGNEP